MRCLEILFLFLFSLRGHLLLSVSGRLLRHLERRGRWEDEIIPCASLDRASVVNTVKPVLRGHPGGMM